MDAQDLERSKIKKPLLVGESNPYGGREFFALFPRPDGSAGWRLCHAVFGMAERDYLRSFDRTNLLEGGGTWSPPKARYAAAQIADQRGEGTYVLCGVRVAEAFGFIGQPAFTMIEGGPGLLRGASTRVFFLPHPSGRCRVWNEPGAIERARALLPQILET